MERKNITIREDQAEWVAETDTNLSQLVQEAIDEAMGPDEEELAEAYRANADDAAATAEEWADASAEATDHLGTHPDSPDAHDE
jgi:regulator of protease activity HflC (stomatin/prohibitin superfamily)